jgi:hypothetical protein
VLLDLHGRTPERRGHGRRRELHAGRTAGGQDGLLVGAELPEPPLDHLAQTLGHADLDLVQARSELPAPIALRDEPARGEVVDDADHEQRVALGAAVDDGGQLGGKRVAAKATAQVVAHRLLAEQLERQLLTPPLRLQLELDVLEGMLTDDEIDRPIGADQEQSRGLAAAGEERYQVHRGRVTPVQVLEDEHQGRLGRQGLDGDRHFPQHAIARGPQELPFQGDPIGAVQQPRHLHEPGGRVAAEERDEPVAARLPTQPTEGIEHR